MAILAVNAGSSTLKFSLHPLDAGGVLPGVMTGSIEGLEFGGTPSLRWRFGEREHKESLPGTGDDRFAQALAALRTVLEGETGLPPIEAMAHRVVHGGRDFRASVIVNDAILEQLEALNALAPLHQPHNIAGIRAFRQAYPALPQVACFDTAFHATLPALEYTLALPRALADEGVRRYGFHGLSYQYIMGALQERTPLANARVLMAHLGNGASLCAARDGRSCATSMGFSTLDGLMMGTRSGSLDAGVLLYLLEQGWDHDRLQALLYKQSGLLGVSGISADMRALRADTSPAARQAIDLFTHRVICESGAFVARLGGLDLLAFSGGIGEHDALLRDQVCAGLAFLGVRIDAAANAAATGDAISPVHAQDSPVQVWVVPTDEGRVAAREAAALLPRRV
jgi:acetate kinase